MKTSKITSIIFILFIGFAFISCSSDDDAPKDDPKQDLLVGKWFFESSENGEPLTDCQKTSYLEFYSNGTAYALLSVDNSAGVCTPLMDTKYKYELVSDKKIKFTVINDDSEGSVFNTEIVSVSTTKLVLNDFAFMPGKVNFKK